MRFGARMIDGILLGCPSDPRRCADTKPTRAQGDASKPGLRRVPAFSLTFFLVYFLVVIAMRLSC